MASLTYVDLLRRERYEALAQVAVLILAAEGAQHPLGMANEGDVQFWYERLNRALVNAPTEARALIDQIDLLKRELQQAEDAEDLLRNRLQRAEAVVEAAKKVTQGHRETCFESSDSVGLLAKALTAWEEGTA